MEVLQRKPKLSKASATKMKTEIVPKLTVSAATRETLELEREFVPFSQRRVCPMEPKSDQASGSAGLWLPCAAICVSRAGKESRGKRRKVEETKEAGKEDGGVRSK